jgi:hypothetical protein
VIVLGLRLVLVLHDKPQRFARFAVACAVHLVSLSILEITSAFWCFAGLIVVSYGLHWMAERRCKDVLPIRLLFLMLWLLILSFITSERSTLGFAPWLPEAFAKAGRYNSLLKMFAELQWNGILPHACGVLLCMNEVNLPIRWLIDRLNLKPTIEGTQKVAEDEYNRGRIVGILERVLVYFFIVNASYAGFGVLLAAKGIARWPSREDANKDFIEYVLIGTLLSFTFAGATALLIRALLAA